MNTLQQQLPKRFTDAVSKLYNAFHGGTLEYGDCRHCAVGSIVGNGSWGSVFCGVNLECGDLKKQIDLNYYVGEAKESIDSTGYSVNELAILEWEFCKATGIKEDNYKGLCAVIEYLCKLDNIPNIMDFTSLFETENEKPVKQLSEVLCQV